MKRFVEAHSWRLRTYENDYHLSWSKLNGVLALGGNRDFGAAEVDCCSLLGLGLEEFPAFPDFTTGRGRDGGGGITGAVVRSLSCQEGCDKGNREKG